MLKRMGPVGAIGLFLSLFGLWLFVAIPFTETAYGKETNAISGGIILAIGLTAFLLDVRKKGSASSKADSTKEG
ncbi:MAG: hypothetical protein GXO73_05700 [Calditrichaeota bacterium]|nr:hypothetical protein [Calditrichota bacterium]